MVSSSSASSAWQAYEEQLGFGAKHVSSNSLKEQLNLTENDVDYLWYSASAPKGTQDKDVKVSTEGGSMAYAFVEGDRVHVLSVAMGLKNGGVGPTSRKGVTAVKVGGKALSGPWNHSWILEGEDKRIFEEKHTDAVSWTAFAGALKTSPATWVKSSFDLPLGTDLSDADTAFALDLSTMSKGLAYVNGFLLGRYWLKPGKCSGNCAPPVKNGHCYMHWKDCDKPTQSTYHIPSDVLKTKGNLVVLFEEASPSANSLSRDPSGVKLVALQAGKQQVAKVALV